MTNIWKSHKFFIFEKYYSIIAELNNLNRIVQIYKKRNILNNNFSTLITSLKNDISNEFHRIENLNHNDFFYILIELDHIKETMQKIINHEHLIHSKIIQEIMESSPNIRPLPPIQKRYSSKVLSNLLDNHHELLYKSLSLSQDNTKIYSIWSHNDGYAINDFSAKVYFSKHSFYYHDIAWNIPTIIDHEIILKAIRNNDIFRKKLTTITKKIQTACISSIEKDTNIQQMIKTFEWKTYFNEFKDFIEINLENTLLELSADILGAELHGEEYIMSFLHETLGEYLGRDFYVNNVLQNHLSFGLSTERDSLLLRQAILTTTYAPSIGGTTYLEQLANGFYRLFIQDNETNQLSFEKKMKLASQEEFDANEDLIQTQISNHLEEAKYYRRTFSIIYTHIMEKFIENDSITAYLETLIKNINWKNTSPFFNNDKKSIAKVLWEQRTTSLQKNKLPHRSILRQQLLKNLNIDNVCEPYTMHYRHNIKTKFTDTEKVVFGTYSDINIKPITEYEIDIKDKIKTCINSFSNDESNYFETKHTLLKIKKWSNNYSTKNKTKLYILIHLKDSKNPKKIITLIEKLLTSLKNKKDDFSLSCISLFKSFGPEDIVLDIETTNNIHIWEIIEFIRNEYSNEIQETFSSIVIEEINDMQNLNNNIWLKGYYRVKTNINYKYFLKELNSLKKINSYINDNKILIYDVTDKFYDFEIWWNKVPLAEINSFHNERKMQNIILDMEYYMVQGKE